MKTSDTHSEISRTTPKVVTASERRRSRRCKIKQMVRVRPSNPELEHFEEVCGTTSMSRSGVYFHTQLPAYELGMRLFVTIPYTDDPAALSREYLAEVVRLDTLDEESIGVGLKLLMDLGLAAHTFSGVASVGE